MDQGVGQQADNIVIGRQVEEQADDNISTQDIVDLIQRRPGAARPDADPSFKEALDGVAQQGEKAEQAAEEDEIYVLGEDIGVFSQISVASAEQDQAGASGSASGSAEC